MTTLHINEIESSGGTPGDWVELVNSGTVPIDVSGWKLRDDDDTHAFSVLRPGTTIAPGGYLVVEEAALGFGLGSADSVRLYDPAGALYESYSWTASATTTYGRCPNATGAFTTTAGVTKGAANDCGTGLRLNEIESTSGVPGDWVELVNPSASPLDISGFVLRDDDDDHAYTIPASTVLAAGAYYVVDDAVLGFGLGSSDSVRLFDPNGSLVDSFSWTAHAATTYGRCPDATGGITETKVPTRGLANECPGEPGFPPWPGDPTVTVADDPNVFGENLSGLDYEGSGSGAPGDLWAVRNNPSTLFRLIFDGSVWAPDTSNGWSAGKALHFPGGTGSPDAEGVTLAGSGSSGGVYVSTEQDNDAVGVPRFSVLRFAPSAPGTSLTATHEWNLTSDLPAAAANFGLESITWVPDSFLVAHGFFDESRGHPYDPAEYPGHGSGLFFVGLEANGTIYAYALDHVGGGYTRIATIPSGLPYVMDLEFDGDDGNLWAICDDTCIGRSAVLHIDAATGRFVVAGVFERPAGMPNLNTEGFAVAPATECVRGRKPVYWADDFGTDGHAVRRGTLPCAKSSATIVTTASPGNVLGAPVFDTATVSGSNPTGTVTFQLFGDTSCTTPLFTSTTPLAGGTATSGTFTPTQAGTYLWTASYSGDADNYSATSPCGAANESVVIGPFAPPAFTRSVTGDVRGLITVSAGQSVLLSNARVAGRVRVEPGGALTVVNSQISGGIVVDRPAFFSVCGSQVSGSSTLPGQGIVVANATVPLRIGDPAVACAGNRVAGDVILTANTAGLTLGSNVVSGRVTVDDNTMGTHVVKANTIFETLACAGNSPPPTNAGQPNQAGAKSGQCLTL